MHLLQSIQNVKENKAVKQNVSSFQPNKDNFNSNNNQLSKKHQKQLNNNNIVSDNFINNNDYINDINYSSRENNQKSKNSPNQKKLRSKQKREIEENILSNSSNKTIEEIKKGLNEKPEEEKKLCLHVKIKLSDGKYENLEIKEGDDLVSISQNFQKKNEINENLITLLFDKINDAIKKFNEILKIPLSKDSINNLNYINDVAYDEENMSYYENLGRRSFSTNDFNIVHHKNTIKEFMPTDIQCKRSESLG